MADKTKVLVLDDDPDVRATTQLFLESRGFDVLTAAGPEEGLRQVETQNPDVVVLDIMMPDGTEGFHWVWKIRRHSDSAVRDVPVIVVSSIRGTTGFHFGTGDSDETGDYLPVQGFLDKPADPDELARKIRAVLSKDA